jgi:hypothetical protein
MRRNLVQCLMSYGSIPQLPRVVQRSLNSNVTGWNMMLVLPFLLRHIHYANWSCSLLHLNVYDI